MTGLHGIWGHPYLDLERYFDLSVFPILHEEICLGLAHVEPSYTGGSLKWMKVVSPSAWTDPYVDYGHVIERFSLEEFDRFVKLADNHERFDRARHKEYSFGDETDHPLNYAQMKYLKYRYGVYFPWKVAFHFVENDSWEDKHLGRGKGFTKAAEEYFPKTVAFLKSLPFREIGRCLIFGLEANDHAPLHRDTEPRSRNDVDHTLTLCPNGDKRFVLTDENERDFLVVPARAYWFNDMDFHGVAPDPFFRYSIRVDGVYEDWFFERLRNDWGAGKVHQVYWR